MPSSLQISYSSKHIFELEARHGDFLFCPLGDGQVATLISTTKQSFINNLTSQAILVICQILHLHSYSKRKALNFTDSDLEFQLEAQKYIQCPWTLETSDKS